MKSEEESYIFPHITEVFIFLALLNKIPAAAYRFCKDGKRGCFCLIGFSIHTFLVGVVQE